MKTLLFFVLVTFSSLSLAQVYECKVNGKSSFQSKPCTGSAIAQDKSQTNPRIKSVQELSKIHLETYTLPFSKCKSEVLNLQFSATQQGFKSIVLENTSTNYNVKVCMPPNSAILMTCDGMKRKMFVRRRAPCE